MIYGATFELALIAAVADYKQVTRYTILISFYQLLWFSLTELFLFINFNMKKCLQCAIYAALDTRLIKPDQLN